MPRRIIWVTFAVAHMNGFNFLCFCTSKEGFRIGRLRNTFPDAGGGGPGAGQWKDS